MIWSRQKIDEFVEEHKPESLKADPNLYSSK